MPNFWRPPNDNDYCKRTTKTTTRMERNESQFWIHDNTSFTMIKKKKKKRAELSVTYSLKSNRVYQIKYNVYINGFVTVTSSFLWKNKGWYLIDVPRIGLRFRLPLFGNAEIFRNEFLKKIIGIVITVPTSTAIKQKLNIFISRTLDSKKAAIISTLDGLHLTESNKKRSFCFQQKLNSNNENVFEF